MPRLARHMYWPFRTGISIEGGAVHKDDRRRSRLAMTSGSRNLPTGNSVSCKSRSVTSTMSKSRASRRCWKPSSSRCACSPNFSSANRPAAYRSSPTMTGTPSLRAISSGSSPNSCGEPAGSTSSTPVVFRPYPRESTLKARPRCFEQFSQHDEERRLARASGRYAADAHHRGLQSVRAEGAAIVQTVANFQSPRHRVRSADSSWSLRNDCRSRGIRLRRQKLQQRCDRSLRRALLLSHHLERALA